jgi:hypothetical protein
MSIFCGRDADLAICGRPYRYLFPFSFRAGLQFERRFYGFVTELNRLLTNP